MILKLGTKTKEELNNVEGGIVIENDGNELDRLWQLFVRCQLGDRSSLDELFKASGQQVCNSTQEIYREETENYKQSHIDDLWDGELIKDEIKEEQKKREYRVLFSLPCLNKLVNKVKGEFNQKSINTGYENGKKTGNGGKYEYGKYDLVEIEEVMQQTVIEIFQAQLDQGMITIDKKTFPDPVTDGLSLFKCIKYFLKRRISKKNDLICRDVSECGINADGEEFSYFDVVSQNRWLTEGNDFEQIWNQLDTIELMIWEQEEKLRQRESRLLVYADILKWIQRNDVHKLFRADAVEIQAIIDAIMECDQSFKEGCYSGKRFVTYNELQKLIEKRNGNFIDETNIATNLKLIEQRLLDNSLYALNFEISKSTKNQDRTSHDEELKHEKESRRVLRELEKKSYKKLFSRESMCIYDICNLYMNKAFDNDEVFLTLIRRYENVICPILECYGNRKKYDMINLLTGDMDIVVQNYLYNSETFHMSHLEIDKILERVPKDIIKNAVCKASSDLSNTIMEYYHRIEDDCIKQLLGKYTVKKAYSENKYELWEVILTEQDVNIRFFANRNVKRPVIRRIDINHILAYEGYCNLYFCDTKSMNYYCVNKNNRVITKSDYMHNIFFEKIS